MVNFNGELVEGNGPILYADNRGLQFGDALFERLRVVNGDVFFLEEHYLRLMSSMRILRMVIPMNFTMEFMEAEILRLISNINADKEYEIKFTVFRNSTKKDATNVNSISYVITAKELEHTFFTMNTGDYEVELYKDFYKNSTMLSNLETTNKILYTVAEIYANENDYDDCLLLNERKQVVETLKGNIFLVKDKCIKTPPLTDGCLNGVLRKKLMDIIAKLEDYQLLEESISPFELQKADEIFLTNSIDGIVSISKYRKKNFNDVAAKALIGKLNAAARLSLTKTV
ncbi:branched-chain amino acid aminotransferase [Maribacter sedimenticola]|uniref:branched-chain-amino-acid transaminase n=1 Tax=Maribacter sedimenticola TaxID=228956 RepID=A0ABY1SI89_9FLAO|nr:aminotransferase class IV [Maribacter sedimenticola]SNR48762.1 branched-chain amino acid aminotransferase [Maribacter sedimenticola]